MTEGWFLYLQCKVQKRKWKDDELELKISKIDLLSEIREKMEQENVSCEFSEPKFNPDIIKAVAKDTNIKTGVIDPLGATLNPGKTLYFDLISNMSKSFKGC